MSARQATRGVAAAFRRLRRMGVVRLHGTFL
jgi:hypothetical protein